MALQADGRPLYVYRKYNGGATAPGPSTRQPARAVEPVQPEPIEVNDVDMEVDENAESREAENRRREEHRRRDDRDGQVRRPWA